MCLKPRELIRERLAAVFNEWMRRYIEEPERFEREFQAVAEYQSEQAHGLQPSYGRQCADYIFQINGELE